MVRLFSICGVAAVLTLVLLAPGLLAERLGGDFEHAPEDAEFMLGARARTLLARAFAGFEDAALADYNVHALALGTADNDGYLNSHLRSWWYPLQRLRLGLLLDAAGVHHLDRIDDEYRARLVRLTRAFPPDTTFYLSALDRYYGRDGEVNRFRTRAYVPNGYVARLSVLHPQAFEPVVSIHPYRDDAFPALERWAAAGVRMLYWMPVVQGIDPADPRLEPFYEAMNRHNMTLLVHVGSEGTLYADGEQAWGNPLRLRPALDAGLTVVMLTGGSLGMGRDLDRPGHPPVENYRLFLRLMNEPRYRGQLYGDISALFYGDRSLAVLSRFLQRRDLQSRLVYGSDYPFSAVDVNIRLGRLVEAGFLSREQGRALNEIYRYNPLLFNFATARTVHLPDTDVRFDEVLFTRRPVLAGAAPVQAESEGEEEE